MTQEDALYAAILAAPADDFPRLVFADWLEEQGNEDHANFIRYQLESAKTFEEYRYLELKRYEHMLWLGVRNWYAERLPPSVWGAEDWQISFIYTPCQIGFGLRGWAHVTRGFVSRVRNAEEHLDTIRANHPIERIT